MDFITISVKCPSDLSDVIIAELFEIGFDSFQEFDNGFEGSCETSSFSEAAAKEVIKKYREVSYSLKEEEKVNWNKEWEKNYDPIQVDNKCLVRATFHQPDPSMEYDIVVNPKMSFGTGHHATTYQILSYQMTLDHQDKKVLDVGCGTGILSIMAAKRGASEVMATDIDDWCIENSQENFSLNQVINIQLKKGQVDVVRDFKFDIVIANINKNVLMDQVKTYSSLLNDNGYLLLSGFYKADVPDLIHESKKHGLLSKYETTKEDWAMVVLTKPKV